MRTFRKVWRIIFPFLLGVACLMAAAARAYGQNSGSGANSDPTYQALRNITLGTEAVTVNDLKLKRDAGTFTLNSGVVCFVAPVNEKVTGAVFVGQGTFTLLPPTAAEAN